MNSIFIETGRNTVGGDFNMYVYTVLVFLAYLITYFILKNKLHIKSNEEKLHINTTHKITEITIAAIALIILFLIGFVFDYGLKPHYPVVILSAILLVRALFERKYMKDSKRHVLSILTSSALFIMFIGIEIFFI